jgi:hypothetical protein
MPALLNFNANPIAPMGEFTPIPTGKYTVIISASEMKDTKPVPGREPGQYLQLVLDVVDEGEHFGRKVFCRLNLVNANATAVKIAESELSAICRAVGVMVPKTTEELHDIPFIVKVTIRPEKDGYQATNEVSGYERVDGVKLADVGDGVAKGAPVAAGTAPTGAVGKKQPWQRKRKD